MRSDVVATSRMLQVLVGVRQDWLSRETLPLPGLHAPASQARTRSPTETTDFVTIARGNRLRA